VLTLAVVSLGVPLAINLGNRVSAEVRSQALGQVDVVAAVGGGLLTPATTENKAELELLVKSAAPLANALRILVVNGSGVVLADSAGPASIGTNYATSGRPEILAALRGSTYQGERASTVLHETLLATAVPILSGRRIIGAVRATQSVSAVHGEVRRTILGLGLIGLLVLVIGLSMGAFIAGQIARPLRRLERVARRIAGGELTARAVVEGSSEQRSLGESFNEMADRVQRLLAAQRNFVADASHELRTPLTGLRLRLEEGRAAGVSAQAAGELDAAAREVDRFAQIIDELLVLSRAGERELPGEEVELDELAAGAVERWRRTAGERRIELTWGRNGAVPAVWCARADAERALDSLVENALRYSPRGSRVTIAVAPGAVEIRDGGPGLAEGEEELVFERFHRGSAGRAGGPGSGLGLAIARELAREWGGEVTLQNGPDGGAVATLRLGEAR
jgi:signal transduction histidine kinase